MVYYRTYRPQTIGELDSVSVRETLFAVLSKKDIPHAFLFTGPKGLGKTSTARIIAKVVNCEHTAGSQEHKTKDKEQKEKVRSESTVRSAQDIEPDNTCDQCVSITNGTNIDVLEIDGASNRGIDEIRDLRERVRLAPSHAKKKVYIIDEVHMLTTEAFNALLKTIEEPPSHVLFMFCTTEPHKVPATILSRCFHVRFSVATENEIVHSLERIVTGEQIAIEDAALTQIAHLADGGFRDAAKLLEEVVTLSDGKKITSSFVAEKLHIGGLDTLLRDLFTALSTRNAKGGLEVLRNVVEQGVDIKFFTTEAINNLHQLLLQRVGVLETSDVISDMFSLEEIRSLLLLFSDAMQQVKFSVISQLPLELLIIGWCANEQKENIVSTVDIPKGYASKKPTIEGLLKKEQNLKVRNILYPQDKEETKKSVKSIDQPEITNHSNGKEMLMENIIYKVKPMNASVAGVLRGCIIGEMTESEIIFETAYKFHKDRLEEAKTYAIIEKVVREVTGKSLHVKVQLKK